MEIPIVGSYGEEGRHIKTLNSRSCHWERDPRPSSVVLEDSKSLRGSANIYDSLIWNMYVHQKVQNHSVLKTFSYSVEILAMVSQELYSTPVKISLHCAVRTPLSQSPVVRKVVMSTLLWSRRRFDGLQEKKTPKEERSEISRVAVCQNLTPTSAGTSRLHVVFLFICGIYLPWRLPLFKLAACKNTV